MESRIPIDELFHEKLSEGKEQINLGAWANMERMLDGKNPYTDGEEKKKRRILPFFLLFLITAGLAGGAYLLKSGKGEHASKASKQERMAKKSSEANDMNSLNNDIISTPQSVRSADEKNTHPTLHNQELLGKNGNTTNHTSYTKEKNEATNNQQNIDNATSQESTIADTKSLSRKERKAQKALAAKIAAANKIVMTTTTSSRNNDENINTNGGDNESMTEAQNLAESASEAITKRTEKIPTLTVNQRKANRGNKNEAFIEDTVSRSIFEKVIEETTKNERVAIAPKQSNPRLKTLSAEEELNAQMRNSEPSTKNELIVNSNSKEKENSISTNSEISINANQKIYKEKKSGFFDDLGKFFNDAYNKVDNFMRYGIVPDVITGMTAGVNTSINNAKRSVGGFQAGFTLLKPVSDYFSFLGELKFFYRNNGGYSANDLKYSVINPSKDTSSLHHVGQVIYGYQVDSTIKTYNFKNIYSFELPLMGQLNYRSFALYGGVNIVYNLRLKTTTKTKNYVTNYSDTMPSSEPFAYPIDRSIVFQNSDFASRLGIGYTVGASYNFSPQLYVDLRIAQNVWDNMKTNTAREISNGFFKVPTMQISLGYRFKKFVPNN